MSLFSTSRLRLFFFGGSRSGWYIRILADSLFNSSELASFEETGW
jgi:hypothetical protein